MADEIFKLTGRGEWYGALASYTTKPDVQLSLLDDGTLIMHMVGKIDASWVEDVRLYLSRAAKTEAPPGSSFVTTYKNERGEKVEETWPPQQPIVGN